MTTDGFNPEHVPPFPVYNLTVTEDGTVKLDGATITPDPEQPAGEAGTQAAAHKAAAAGLEAVRVRAHADGSIFDMVITADGDVHDTTQPERKKPSGKKKSLILGASVAVVLALTGAVWTGATAMHDEPEPVAATPTTPPGAGTAVPAGLPAGFSPQASWTHTVDADTGARQLADGSILTISPSGTLVAYDEATGKTVWEGRSAPSTLDGLVETTWQGRPVLATADGSKLLLWARDMPAGQLVPQTSVDVGNNATVSFAGTNPLIDLGDYTVAIPDDEGLRRISIQPGTTAAANVDSSIISIGEGTIVHTPTAGLDAAQSTPYTLPKGAKGRPTGVIGLSQDTALLTWGIDKGTLVGLLNLETGKVTATTKVDRLSTNLSLTYDTAAETALVGDLFIDYSADSPVIMPIDLSGNATATLYDHSIYTHTTDAATLYTVTNGLVGEQHWDTYSEEDPTPVLITRNAAYVVASKVDSTVLYSSPRTSDPTNSSSPASPSTTSAPGGETAGKK